MVKATIGEIITSRECMAEINANNMNIDETMSDVITKQKEVIKE